MPTDGARIIVAIVLANGGRPQAVCRTLGCTAGEDDGPWQGTAHLVKAGAEDDAVCHRAWHRAQQTIPAEASE
jgi:hypothetical protein